MGCSPWGHTELAMPEGLVFISTCRCSHQNMQTLSSALALGKNASCFYQLLFRCNSRVMKDGLTVHSRYDMKASQVSVNSRMNKEDVVHISDGILYRIAGGFSSS